MMKGSYGRKLGYNNKHATNVTKMTQFTTIRENKEKHIYAQVSYTS